MKKIDLKELKNYFEKEIEVQGFIDNVRNLQYVQFVVIRDRTGKLQITIEKTDENKKLNEIVASLIMESTLKVSGKLIKNENVKLNGMELIPISIEVTSASNKVSVVSVNGCLS